MQLSDLKPLSELQKMGKKELGDYCKSIGIPMDHRMKKVCMVDATRTHQKKMVNEAIKDLTVLKRKL